MHKEYWVAIGLYAVVVVLTALPFLGIVRIDIGLGYETMKFLHIVFVFVAISVLVGQLIAYNVMQHARITTQEALRYLSLLDHVIPVCLVIIGVLGYSMAARYGEIWEVAWIHESAFGLLIYAVCGLILALIFRRVRFQEEGGHQSSGGVYVASGVGIAFLLVMTAVMVFKAAPVRTAHHFTGVARYFAGP
jgi:uncharacterized membrane protein SirB2